MNRDEARALIQRQFEDGPLSAEDRARLFEALRDDAELKALYDRYAEMEAGLEDGGLHAMKARLQADAAAAVEAERAPVEAPAEPPAPAEAPAAPVIDLAAQRAARRRWVVAGVGAAAAIALFGLLGRDPAVVVPAYAFELSAGAQALRGPEQETLRFEPSTRFSVVLRPERSVEGGLEARAALISSERSYPATAPWSAAAGAFKLEGRTEALFDAPPGAYELVVVVGPQGSLPTELRAVQASETLRVWRREVQLVHPGRP